VRELTQHGYRIPRFDNCIGEMKFTEIYLYGYGSVWVGRSTAIIDRIVTRAVSANAELLVFNR